MSKSTNELAAAIAAAIEAARESGIPLEIKIGGVEATSVSDNPVNAERHLNDIEAKLLAALGDAAESTLTLTQFAEHLGQDESKVRGALRGSGRSSKTVQDTYYERFDSVRPEGGKVRTYRLLPAGRAWLSR